MRILLVEDEDTIRDVIDVMLSGIAVVEYATDGETALQLYRERGPFDVVLTDMEHLGANGLELRRAVLAINPEQSIGFLTGHPILQKPFDRAQLLDFVRKLKPNPAEP